MFLLLLLAASSLSLSFSLEMHEDDEMREKIIKRSREILKARHETLSILFVLDDPLCEGLNN